MDDLKHMQHNAVANESARTNTDWREWESGKSDRLVAEKEILIIGKSMKPLRTVETLDHKGK